MTEKENILSKWLQGEVSEEEVKSTLKDIDLDQLRNTLDFQEQLDISTTDPTAQWDFLESKLPEQSSSSTKSSPWKWILLSLLLLISALGVYYFFSSKETVIQAKSKFIQYAFEDGSSARLWPGSSISFNESTYSKERFISLEGEAFFDVEKGLPFKVKTAAGEIEVLGTSFNVWSADKKNTEVKCYTGRVRVTDNHKNETILTKGNKVTIDNSKLNTKRDFDASKQEESVAFKIYDNVDVNWVLDDLENLYSVKIKKPKNTDNQRFTGSISLVDLDQSFIYLCETMQWMYERKDQVVTIKEKD